MLSTENAGQAALNVDPKAVYDAIIIGGGPAGLAAAIYLSRAQYRVLVLEKEAFGGQIRITDEVVNYPGLLRTDGRSLTATMRQQAENFGAEFLLAEAQSLDLSGTLKVVHSSRGPLYSFALLIATGANPRRIGFAGEEDFQGRGVAYCATCDGEFFTGREVLVVGGGFAAAEEAVFLTKYASQVTVLVRREQFSCAASAARACLEHPKIQVRFNTTLEAVGGDEEGLRYAELRDKSSGERWRYQPADGRTFGVFVFAGYVPASSLVQGLLDLDERGYIITDEQQRCSVPGVYAAGDICIKELRQVVTAVSDGAIAATSIEKYAEAQRQATGLHPEWRAPEQAPSKDRQGAEPASQNTPESAGFFSPEIRQQVQAVAARFSEALVLRVYQDERPVSQELAQVMAELAEMAPERLSLECYGPEEEVQTWPLSERPLVQVCQADGRPSGLAFHGVPGGHEFQSFILGLYNAAGPGQAVEDELRKRAQQVAPSRLQLLVSLSCTQCPELVVAAGRLATLSGGRIRLDVYDLNHFAALKEEHQIMSVPCILLQEGKVKKFGRKNMAELLDLLEETAASEA